jgi:hypothetical protein
MERVGIFYHVARRPTRRSDYWLLRAFVLARRAHRRQRRILVPRRWRDRKKGIGADDI